MDYYSFTDLSRKVVNKTVLYCNIYLLRCVQEWMVDGISTERHETIYACCEEPYPDVTFTIHMRRGSMFYVVNLIAPCFLIFVISFLGFFLPVESGDKVNLETTILLALVVFLLMVGETMPPIPDVIPILGKSIHTQYLFIGSGRTTLLKGKKAELFIAPLRENLTPEALRYGSHRFYPANTLYPPFTS